jgi:hypothetical protein
MKTITLIMVGLLCLPNILFSQNEEDKSYTMYETIYLMPKAGESDAFEKAVKEHNEKYHSQAPYTAFMRSIVTGPKTGWYVWVMGPTMFSHLDNRPAGEHDDDWAKNVTPHVAKGNLIEYWRQAESLSYTPTEDDQKPSKHIVVWSIDLEKGQGYRFRAIMEKIKAAYEKKGDDGYAVYFNQFGTEGRDAAIVWGFEKWAEMDEDDSIKPYFEEVHGEGSWDNMLDEWEDVIKTMSQEVRQLVD